MSQDARKQLTIKTGDDQLRLKNQAKKRLVPDTNEANENLKQLPKEDDEAAVDEKKSKKKIKLKNKKTANVVDWRHHIYMI